MSINLFGQKVREARKHTNHTLLSMAFSLKTTPGFLSAIETGRSKIPSEWVVKIYEFFKDSKYPLLLEDLKEAAEVSNGSVSISDLPLQHKLLIAGFANSELNAEQMDKFKSLLESVYAERKSKDDKNE